LRSIHFNHARLLRCGDDAVRDLDLQLKDIVERAIETPAEL
jgi:hypothetical protein